jgi:hypothetical protein
MASAPELATLSQEPEGRRHENISGTPGSEQLSEQDGGLFSRVFGGAPGEPPPVERASQFLGNPLFSHAANNGLRVLALKRAQQTHGNRFAQRAIAGMQRTTAASASPQRQNGNLSTADSAAAPNVTPAESPGQPLDQHTREFMGPRFGTDFSDVRIHTDARASESAEALSADAYTVGRDIYFAAGKYTPASEAGQHLLAHELTHTVQQTDGSSPARQPSPQSGGAVLPATDEQLERDAEQVAEDITDPQKKSASSLLPVTGLEPDPGRALTADVTDQERDGEAPVKPAPIAMASKERPEAKVAPLQGPILGDVPAAKPAPSPVVARKGATRESPVRLPAAPSPTPLPPLPILEPPVDLIEPTSVAPEFGALPEAQVYNPEMAAFEVEGILEQLHTAAEIHKKRIHENSERVKTNVAESGATQQTAVRARVSESLNIVQKQIAASRADISAEAEKVKASVAANSVAGFHTLLMQTSTQVKAINDSAEAHKKKASQAVVTEREAVRKFGADEGQRGKNAIDKQAKDASAKGRSKASQYAADERGQVQAQAVLKVAADVAEKLAEPGPELQSSVTDGGKELATGIGDVDKELAKTIDDQTPKITAELFKQSAALEPQFETIRMDIYRGVDDFVGETNRKLDAVEESATKELQALELYLVAQIGASVSQIQAMLDSETEAEVASIDANITATYRATRRIRHPHVRGVRTALEKAQAALDDMVERFMAGLDELAATAQRGFADGGEKVVGEIATIAANVRGGLATVRGPVQKGLETLGNKAKEGSDKINEEWRKSLEGTQKAVDAKYDEAVAGMVKEIDKNLAAGKGKLTSQVNEALTKNREPLDQLDTKMEEAAKEARDKYDAPWYKKVGRWLLHALTSFLKALGMLLLVVLALVAAIVLIIVGLVFDIIALIVIGIIALLAVVVYVLYGIVKGWIARVMSANTWWQAAWAGVVGILDITGIPGVIEGIIHRDIVNGRKLTEEEAGDRFGSGFLGLLLFIIPLKAKGAPVPVEGPRIPVEIPTEPPPVLPVEPTPVIPAEPKPVAPLEPPIPKPTEPPPVPPSVEPPSSIPKPGDTPAPKPAEPTPTVPKPQELPPATPKPAEPAPVEPQPVQPPQPKAPEPLAEPKPTEPTSTIPEDKPAEPTAPGEAKPGETPTEKPPEPGEISDPGRAEMQKELADLQAKKAAAEARWNERLKAGRELKNQAKALRDRATIERRDDLSRQAREAEDAAAQAFKDAERARMETADAQLQLQKKALQLNTDLRSKLPCFAAGTLVWTPAGPRAIDELAVNDLVLAYDFESCSTVQRRILTVFRNWTRRFYCIDVNGVQIQATSLHRFWCQSEGDWIEARDLRPGMQLRMTSGEVASVRGIDVRESPCAATFNLHIEESCTYFVGPGVLVHNAGGPSYNFGKLRIYEGVNPKFPDKVYIGQTDDIERRQGEHRAEAEKKLEDLSLSQEEREFWEFKKDMVLKERVAGLNPDQANYLEQKNIDIETEIRGERNVMNRREQVSRKNMPALEAKIKADPKVQEAGLCP